MISWDRVNELREEIGDDDFGEVVEIFLDEVDETIDRLRVAPDPARFEDDLHFLKGCALNLGFDVFGKLCQEGESSAASQNIGEIDLPAVISVYESSKAEFISQIDQQTASK